MVPEAQPEGVNVTWYNVAAQFYNQELSIIGQRSNAFLVVQSILVVALATFLTNTQIFPYALVLIMWGISILGSLFCLQHYLSGLTGATSAKYWRRYMRTIENSRLDTPWKQFGLYWEKEGGDDLINLTPAKGHLDRPPWPTAWIITPPDVFGCLGRCVGIYCKQVVSISRPTFRSLTSMVEFGVGTSPINSTSNFHFCGILVDSSGWRVMVACKD